MEPTNYQEWIDKAVQWGVTSGLQVMLISVLLVVGLITSKWISFQLMNVLTGKGDDLEMKKRKETLGTIVHKMLKFVVLGVGLMMILDTLGIQIGPILAAAGVLGIAIGFGAQKLVEDIIGGFFILWSDQIRVGDVVQIAGVGGLVERVDLRMVVLRDLAGNVHFVRNGQIGIVTNMTKEFSQYVFDIGVAYREDTDEVVEVIKRVDEDLRRDPAFAADILAPVEILGVDKFADSAVIIKARTKTRPIKQWAVGREFNRRLKKAFDAAGIEIPFPHVTLYMGQGKDRTAPPLYVQNTAGARS